MKYAKKLYALVKDEAKIEELDFVVQANTSVVITALVKHLENELEQARSTPVKDYDNASWAYYQAHKNGEVETIKKLLDLLS